MPPKEVVPSALDQSLEARALHRATDADDRVVRAKVQRLVLLILQLEDAVAALLALPVHKLGVVEENGRRPASEERWKHHGDVAGRIRPGRNARLVLVNVRAVILAKPYFDLVIKVGRVAHRVRLISLGLAAGFLERMDGRDVCHPLGESAHRTQFAPPPGLPCTHGTRPSTWSARSPAQQSSAPEVNSTQVTAVALIAFIIVGARFPELDATPLR